ncbi:MULTISPECIES: hypothetical protein [Mycobacterium]|uniref:Uncharacterized protein n=1 Tax=Mycobacterium lentiflavum TaxID=141349 RepID=A0A0E4H1G0_MYCLN|nr:MULTISPECIES: hypothetical protein [Mycobacterium]CQD22769.1 hypothetical protein BN1232_05732 [Mycobacterium lentiflavum]
MLSRAEADRHPSKIAKNSPDATTVMDGTTPTDAVPLIRFLVSDRDSVHAAAPRQRG